MKRNQKNAAIAFFWIWTMIFFGITITEMLEMNSRILGAHRILMIYLTGFLFIIYAGIAMNLFSSGFRNKKVPIAETVFFVFGVALFAGFFVSLNHHVPTHIIH